MVLGRPPNLVLQGDPAGLLVLAFGSWCQAAGEKVFVSGWFCTTHTLYMASVRQGGFLDRVKCFSSVLPVSVYKAVVLSCVAEGSCRVHAHATFSL